MRRKLYDAITIDPVIQDHMDQGGEAPLTAEFEGYGIWNPFVSEDQMNDVDPVVYYGMNEGAISALCGMNGIADPRKKV